VLTALLNDLGATAAEIVLVLDDYHVIDARDVQDQMASCSTICLRAARVIAGGRSRVAAGPVAGARRAG